MNKEQAGLKQNQGDWELKKKFKNLKLKAQVNWLLSRSDPEENL